MFGIRTRARSGGFTTLIVAVYLVVGAFVAAGHHYFSNGSDGKGIATAVLAILLWPLVLFGLHIHL